MQYVSVLEYLMGRISIDKLSKEQLSNMNTLIPSVNLLLEKFGSYRKVNSGYRSPEDQAKINPNAPHSKHLICAAVDLEDKDGKLYDFCRCNEQLLSDLGLWCEERQGGWQHLQCQPPLSGHRWFKP